MYHDPTKQKQYPSIQLLQGDLIDCTILVGFVILYIYIHSVKTSYLYNIGDEIRMHMPATLQALHTQANQLIMRCDIAFKILQAVSAKSHHIDIWECLSVVIWERFNGMLGSNSNTWIEVKAGWLVSPP